MLISAFLADKRRPVCPRTGRVRIDLPAVGQATTCRCMTKEDKPEPASSRPSSGRGSTASRWAMMVGIGLGFALLCVAVFWVSERQARRSDIGFPNFADQAFLLLDQTGAHRGNDDFIGAPIALFFGYSYCPDVCPMTLSLLQGALDEAAEGGTDAAALQVVFVTVDAERDTPEQLAAYLSLFDLPVTGLTGDAAALNQVQKAFGIYAKSVEDEDGVVLWDHSSAVYLYDASGRFSGTIVFDEPADFVVQKIQRLLR